MTIRKQSLKELTVQELNKELEFIDNCNPANIIQLNTLVDYASKIKHELTLRKKII